MNHGPPVDVSEGHVDVGGPIHIVAEPQSAIGREAPGARSETVTR